MIKIGWQREREGTVAIGEVACIEVAFISKKFPYAVAKFAKSN